MDKATAKIVSADLEAAVAAVLAKHDLKKSRISVRYGDELRWTLDAISTDPALDPAVTDWNRYAASYGLPVDGLGAKVTVKGVQYTITGLVTGRTRFPVRVSTTTGKTMLLTIEGTRNALLRRVAVEG